MPFLHQIGEELQEKSQHQQTDMHAVHISIGGDNHFVVPEIVQTFLYVQRRLQTVEFLILIHHFLGQSIAVQRLASEREHRLRIHVTTLGDGTGRRQTLSDEDGTLLPQVVLAVFGCELRLRVVVMDATITQFGVVHQVLLRSLTGLFGHTRNCLALTLALLNLLKHNLHHIRMFMQVIIQFALDKIIDELVDRHTTLLRGHILRTELHFGLTLKNRFLHIDGDSAYNTVADVREVHVLIEKLLNRLADSLTICRLMRTALNGMLAVDEGEILVVILVGMSQRYLDIFTAEVNDGIQRLHIHVLRQEVKQSVLRVELLPVEVEREARIEVRIVAHHRLDEISAELVVLEETFGSIGLKLDKRTARRVLGVIHNTGIAHQPTLLKLRTAHLALAERLNNKTTTEHIHGFGSYAIQTDTLLERLRVVLATRIQHRDGIHHLAQRYASAIVPNLDTSVLHTYLHLHLNHLAFAHAKLVNRVVYRLLDEHIDTVVRVASVAQFANIHTRPAADMLAVVQMNNIRLIVRGCRHCLVLVTHETCTGFGLFWAAKLILFFQICKVK